MEQNKPVEEQRREWRDRKRRSRKNKSIEEDEQALAELRRTDPVAARVRELWAEVLSKPITKPGIRYPSEDPEAVKARSEKFDRTKQECERKSAEETKRILWILGHGIPISYGLACFPNGIPANSKESPKVDA